MCGIIGFSALRGASLVAGHRFTECVQSLKHRGPDGSGALGIRPSGHLDESVIGSEGYRFGLGHTRLAILDLSARGRQPFCDESGNWLVYNGEIYNYLELKSELKRHGHIFHTETDTEVILAAYREFGLSCVEHFNGMWAFGLYDSSENRLFLSRDRLGVKPLYYIRQQGLFIFASEIHAALELASIEPVIVRGRLADALIYGLTDSVNQTIYRGVLQLPSGHSALLSLSDHEWRCWRYWKLPEDDDLNLKDGQALEMYGCLLEDAVRIRLRAHVPVALTLSGGIDSSAIALAVSRVQKGSIPAFTSHFPGHAEIDETTHALEVARRCGLESHLIEPDISQLLEEEPLLCRRQEMPFGSLSLYVHWAIIKQIRLNGIKVIFSGQGGDELFLGYERYFVAKVLSSLPSISAAAKDFVACGRNSKLGIRGMGAYQAYFTFDRIQRAHRQRRLLAAFRREIVSPISGRLRKVPTDRRILQQQELLGEQLAHLLRYDDRTVGAHGVETRLPFLDYRLVEFAYRLPWRLKIRDGWSKWISRSYLASHGMTSIAWRRKKLGFNAPTDEWVRQLWEKRGGDLANQELSRRFLKRNYDVDRTPPRSCIWDVYNVLELASLMNWRDVV